MNLAGSWLTRQGKNRENLSGLSNKKRLRPSVSVREERKRYTDIITL